MEAVNGDAEDEGGYEDNMENQIVLHEDKRYYPSAEEIYGQQTETLVMEEDAQPLEVWPRRALTLDTFSRHSLKVCW